MSMTRRTFIRLSGLYGALGLSGGRSSGSSGRPRSQSGREDTPSRIVLSGDYGYEQKSISNLAPGATIDARTASFAVANSKNANPNAERTCDAGMLSVNPYPVVISNCPSVHFIGGRFEGEVPLGSDWRDTYCNSAALLIRDGSTGATLEGVRLRRCWDGIRIGEGADDFHLKGCWVSETRDDAVENDYLASGVVEDCLFEACFSGVSVQPPRGQDRDGTQNAVTIDRSLIGMQAYLAREEIVHGAPIKAADASPRLRFTGSILALSAPNMRFRRLERTWQKVIESRDNALLWLPDEPVPDQLPLPPSGFALLKGAEAREYWENARLRWIGAHPEVARFSDEVL